MGYKYQISLIVLLLATAGLFGVFLLREVFPEYKTYQETFIKLEVFRSAFTGIPPAPFKEGVKQIVMKEGKGPEKIDRCISCHVALEIEDYSPLRIAKDINGEILRDGKGFPVKEQNPSYIFSLLEQTIGQLRDPSTIEALKSQGDDRAVNERLDRASQLEALNGKEMEKALQMHPLMGKETRPLEYHPINEYGCTVCHSGNGRALTVDKAHGPVFDGTYDVEFMGPKPEFLERDPLHDPKFASVFNDKPGDELLFQTTPILVGPLMEARCVQCHKIGDDQFEEAKGKIDRLLQLKSEEFDVQKNNLEQAEKAFLTLLSLDEQVKSEGYDATYKALQADSEDETQSAKGHKVLLGKLQILKPLIDRPHREDDLHDLLEKEMEGAIGGNKLLETLTATLKRSNDREEALDNFLQAQAAHPEATGTLFHLAAQFNLSKAIMKHLFDTERGIKKAVNDSANLQGIKTDVDALTTHFKRGRSLYISQACYACHKIAGFARGGVGPELTEEGNSYPWFVKESIVWPQADLKTSTMPNMVLDHEEVQDLMTFILAQKGKSGANSEYGQKELLKAWDAGQKVSFERAIPPGEIHDLSAGMKTFALQGCASCHRLEGYTSEVGFKANSLTAKYEEEHWFRETIREDVGSRELVRILEEKGEEIDGHIFHGVRPPSIMETIEEADKELLPGFFAPFRFALRVSEAPAWKDRVMRVMKAYYQVYGLGRLIGPRPNWSGIFRSDEWLMEHFWNPSSHVPKSIMPVFPFDDSKFQQLTYMLNELGKRNRDHLRGEWELFGFDPKQAYDRTCAQCHGDQLKGNGPVAPWIYPIPKNLKSSTFLKGLGRERVIGSITHGIKGTPMPPWSETWPAKGEGFGVPVYSDLEVKRMVDWLFDQLPRDNVEAVPPKWRYTPEEVLKELNQEKVLPPLKGGFVLNIVQSSWTEDDLFDKEKGDPYGVVSDRYYLKKDLYTPDNIEAGRRLFLIQCAMCHGTEADGAGTRAEVMQDAKPRMFTNLDWISSRDDLRLLQSITYGVPGTAMTSFADVTTTWQRIQLVLYIRSLSEKNLELKKIKEKLFASTIGSDRFIQDSDQKKLFNEARKGVENLGNLIASKDESSDLLGPSYEKWSAGALPVYSADGVKPPLDQADLENQMVEMGLKKIDEQNAEMERLRAGFLSAQAESRKVEMEKNLKEWRSLVRLMREEFSENRRLWKDLQRNNKVQADEGIRGNKE